MDRLLFAEDESANGVEADNNSLSSADKWKILIVDNEQDVHDVTVLTLKRLEFESRGVTFLNAYSAAEGRELLRQNPDVALALLDVVMEDDNAGLHLVRQIREELKNDRVRIVLRTGHPGQAPEERVTLDYDINDYREKTELTARSLRTVVISALRSFRDLSTIHDLHRAIDATQRELLYALGEIAENRSVETGHHVRRVGEISAILAEKRGLTPPEVDAIRLAAAMHDLGKLAVDDSILNKPGPLTAQEFEIMKNHSQLGYELLCRSKRPLLQMAAVIAREHHENYDGTGYPRGLRGKEISRYSRIVALVDVFDALGTRRVYKDPWPQEKILEYIRGEAGKKFDPRLVALFFAHIDEIRAVLEQYRDP
jgi:response regulator RpfG family c-di-GMP phosphodiesterase